MRIRLDGAFYIVSQFINCMSNILRGRCMHRDCSCLMMCNKGSNGMCECGHLDAWHVNYGSVDVCDRTPGISAMYMDLKRAVELAKQRDVSVTEELERRSRCIICMDAVANVVVLPCRHANMCADCSAIIVAGFSPSCPTCRSPIRRRVRYINTNTI